MCSNYRRVADVRLSRTTLANVRLPSRSIRVPNVERQMCLSYRRVADVRVEKAVYPLDYLVARLSCLVGRPLSQQKISLWVPPAGISEVVHPSPRTPEVLGLTKLSLKRNAPAGVRTHDIAFVEKAVYPLDYLVANAYLLLRKRSTHY